MNICENCLNEFEEQPGLIQICPKCGQEIDSAATLEELIEESSSISEEDATVDADDEFELQGEEIRQDAAPVPQGEIVTQDLDDEVFEIDDEDDFGTTPDESYMDRPEQADHNELLVPRMPVEPGQTTEDLDDSHEMTEFATEVEGEGIDDTDFELQENRNTEGATEVFSPDEKQPTIELDTKPVTASSLDYAEREIVGLGDNDSLDQDADYVISMREKDSQLGSGASGVVYKAVQKSLDRTVAIKLLKKQVMSGTQSQTRKTTPKQKDIEKFLYESQITAGLDHPNVITVHDLGVTGNNTLFYSMKLFEGGKDWSKDFDKNSLIQNLDIFNDVCDAMRRAHRDRIIHRDLKPQNVLVGDFGEVQVTDWGLAIDLNDQESKQFSGGGTPCYMAPEMSKHYLAQQELRSLKSKLEWTLKNAPDNSDEIEVLKERIADNESSESEYCQQIDELSDIYVLGAILFQISAGFPPHLFQISEIHRRKWGSETGKNKVRRELEMSAKGTVASYVVRNLPEPEAREALRDIALKAMDFERENRYSDVASLQQAVKDFREFMRCVEDTHRGNREVDASQDDTKSYVNLNNAIHAYEGAIENYPDYEPANAGLAKARFLFAERALKNQDFELGLSTMTEQAIESQPNPTLASELRDELINQRNRRDRRKRLLVLATMASLVAIGMGVVFGIFAVLAQNQAQVATKQADIQSARAKEARSQQVEASKKEIQGLEELAQARLNVIDLKVAEQMATAKRNLVIQQASLANRELQRAELQAEFDKIENDKKTRLAETQTRIAEVDLQIAELDKMDAMVESERIKEATQFNQYVSRLRGIEESIDEPGTKSRLNEMFQCEDISLPVKNAWELHHLFKRAHPASETINNELTGKFELMESARNGEKIVALLNKNELIQFSSDTDRFERIPLECITDCSVLGLDVSANGRWLVLARDLLNDEYARNEFSLPVVYDLENRKRVLIDSSLIDELTFTSPKPNADGEICQEKYYCRPQTIEILRASANTISFFMVDQRAQRGMNQLRCSVIDLTLENGSFTGQVKKAKIAGQLFLRSPGLATNAGCLATAVEDVNGQVIAAIANSFPNFGVTIVALDKADQLLNSDSYLSDPQSQEKYFRAGSENAANLNLVSEGFTPTAMKLIRNKDKTYSLLIGNGKGEVAEMSYRFKDDGSLFAHRYHQRLINRSIQEDPNAAYQLIADSAPVLPITRIRPVFSSVADDSIHQLETTRAPLHKSAVRKFEQIGNRIYSASETEIFGLSRKSDEQHSATQHFFGQEGSISAMAAIQSGDAMELISVSNLPDNSNKMVRWRPDSRQHDATIKLENFRKQDRTPKEIVAGTVDQKPGSKSICLAFDDGTFEVVDPEKSRTPIGRPRDRGHLQDADAMSNDDIRNGQLKLIDDSNRLIMYSNSIGLVDWNLGAAEQRDPSINSSGDIYTGAAGNPLAKVSVDRTGQNIATTHPNKSDWFVLWQRRDGQEYVANEIGPFGYRGFGQVNVTIEPMISPGGSQVAVVARTRNSYEVELIPAAPTQNPRKLTIYRSQSRTNFRFIKFISDQQILLAEDTVEDGNRVTQLVELNNLRGSWTERSLKIAGDVSNEFQQLAIADAAIIGNNTCFVGFGISQDQSEREDKQTDCEIQIANRRLIVWNQQEVLFTTKLPFSRRIQPRFDGSSLVFFREATRSNPGALVTVDLSQQIRTDQTKSLTLAPIDSSSATRWNLVAPNTAAVFGKESFILTKVEQGTFAPIFDFSVSNAAKNMVMAGDKVLVHHRDDSASVISIPIDDQSSPQAIRVSGLYRYMSMTGDGQQIAGIRKSDQNLVVAATVDFEKNNSQAFKTIETDAIGICWVNRRTLSNLGIAVQGTDNCLLSFHRDVGSIQLKLWNPDGSQLALDDNYSRLPLLNDRKDNIESIRLSSVTGHLLAIVWNQPGNDRSDIWRYAISEKPNENNEKDLPWKWFLVDDSNLGEVSSVDFGEVVHDGIGAKDIAPRIVIGNELDRKKSFKLYAVEMGRDFKAKPLLELSTTDKLQHIDELVGAQFSGDGKSLLSLTSRAATIRLSSGWSQKKNDVDFDSRIRTFNLAKQEKMSSKEKLDALRRELDDATRIANSKSPRETELEKELIASSQSISEAKTQLDEMNASVIQQEEKLKQEYTENEQSNLETLRQEILRKKEELKQLEAELTDAG